MDKLTELLSTLANESVGGGGNPSEPLEPQGVRAVALFLADGRVALYPVEEVAADD